MTAFHVNGRWLVALVLVLAAALPGALAAAAPGTGSQCDPENQATWPACATGSLCWCADADVEYRRDKVILNDLVIYQGGSLLLVRARHAETPSTDTGDSTWNLSGGVRARLAQGQLAADNATVRFEASNLSSASFDGKPATFEETAPSAGAASTTNAWGNIGNPGSDLGVVRGSANTIEYDTLAGGEVRLRGDVRLFDGCKDVHGEGFIYNLAQKSLKSLEPLPGASRERIRGTFQQKCKPAAVAAPAAAAAAEAAAPAAKIP